VRSHAFMIDSRCIKSSDEKENASKCMPITYMSAFALLQTFLISFSHAQKRRGYPVRTINPLHMNAKSSTPHFTHPG
jgi:hypothetical protein